MTVIAERVFIARPLGQKSNAKSDGPVDSRDGEKGLQTTCGLSVAALLALLIWTPVVAAANRDYAVVLQGAHLLEPEPSGQTYQRVGYLPVGTIVQLQGSTRDITVIKEEQRRPFSLVVTQSGLEGWLRENLYQRIADDGMVAVPIASTKLPLFKRPFKTTEMLSAIESEDNCGDGCIHFSRSDGAFLKVNGETDDYYKVTLHRTLTRVQGGKDLEKRERNWYLAKRLVNTGKVRLADPELSKIAMSNWTPKGKPQISESRLQNEYTWQKNYDNPEMEGYQLIREIKDKQGEANLVIVLESEQDKKEITVQSERIAEQSCHAKPSPPAGVKCKEWIRPNPVKQPNDKMVIVNDWPSYQAIIQQIESAANESIIETVDYSGDDPGKVRRIAKGILERQNKYDFILREIADFREPDPAPALPSPVQQ